MSIISMKTRLLETINPNKIKINNKINYKILFTLLTFFIFSVMLIMNINIPMIGDDYIYSFVFTTSNRIKNISDIFESQVTHYNVWGGRIIVHTILQYLILACKPILINCLNSLVFVFFILLIQWHAIGKVKYSLSLTFISFSLTWLLQPAFGETTLWLTGSLNYLWGTTIILLFLLPYRLHTKINVSNKSSIKILSAICMFILGIVAGWISENISLGMMFIAFLFIIFHKKNKRSIPLWSILGLIGTLIGYIFMIIAPGNFARASEAGSTTIPLVIYRLLTYSENFVYYLGLINLLGVITLIVIRRQNKANFSKITPLLTIYYVGIFISIYSMVASPSFPPRAWFGVISLNIIAFGIIFNTINKYMYQEFYSIKICISVFLVFSLSFNIYDAYKDTRDINSIWKKRLSIIENIQKSDNKQITFEKYKAKTKYGMSDAPYANDYISKYYDIDFRLE